MKKAFVFDFDDTLATTDCKVIVRHKNPGGKLAVQVEHLTPAEFNTHTLAQNCFYDFEQFRSDEFIRSANPTFLMALAQEVYDEGHSVYVLTARADNVADAIAHWLCSFYVNPVRVFGVGSDSKKVDIPAEKQKVLQTLKQLFDVVYFYDDDQHNIDLADQVGVKTYLV